MKCRFRLPEMFLAGLLALSPLAAQKPNIVLIIADDLGYGQLGCYGQEKISTPNLDRMAARGMRFTNFYSGSPLCAPARSTLMTGLHAGHTPVRNNGKKRYLYDHDTTLAELLKGAGYVAGGFGKWGLGDVDTPGVAVQQGFDEWFGQYHQVHAHFYYPAYLMHNLAKYPLSENLGGKQKQYAQDEIHRKALDFIRRNEDRPFFAYLAYVIPHVELVVPEEDELPYRGKFPKIAILDPRPGYIGSQDGYATVAGMITRLDRQVGEVFRLLRELGIEDNTVVFFTSDNGAQSGGKDQGWTKMTDFFRGNASFRGYKGEMYEGGIRVPLLARWPGHIPEGSVSHHVGYFPDFLPTLCELAGLQPPARIDGISFLPTLSGSPKEQPKHEYLYWELPSNQTGEIARQAIRRGDWKTVRPAPDAAWELYDLSKDPSETMNVSSEYPAVMEKIRTIRESARTRERDYPEETHRPGVADYVR